MNKHIASRIEKWASLKNELITSRPVANDPTLTAFINESSYLVGLIEGAPDFEGNELAQIFAQKGLGVKKP